MTVDVATLQQRWPLPTHPRPIVVIGCGGIVNDAHLPAYALANFPVLGVYDVDAARSRATAERFGTAKTFGALSDAASQADVVFDVAVPPQRLLEVLEALPAGSVVLMQKPMGTSLREASRIVELCRARRLLAAVNFQLRFSPMLLALRDLICREALGPIVDVDVHLNYGEPWELFPFLRQQPRVEMLIVSIHYFDWIRSILGEPRGVYAKSISHPSCPGIESTRTSAILDYGDATRCCLSLNNNWQHGPRHEACTLRIEGLRGAAVASFGCLIGYPQGRPDALEFVTDGAEWVDVPLCGNWFPHAFQGTMANLQRCASGEDDRLWTNVDDALQTMSLIEALYESSDLGGVRLGAP